MFVKRTLVALILLPIGIAALIAGGPLFIALAAIILLLAAYEYAQLFRTGGYHPATVLVLGGTLLLVLGRAINQFSGSAWMVSLIVLLSMAYHLAAFERGRDQAGTDFAITLSGSLYIGWLGAYFISIRDLPDGLWWLLLVLSAVWFADAGAYLVGKQFGHRPITPRLSPKKTWEGYLGGVLIGTLGTALLALIFQYAFAPDSNITPLYGAVVGFVLSALSILGDLGESMIKRQVGVKDSGTLLPGHGGIFDRIDSWLWAGVIGYYMITLLN